MKIGFASTGTHLKLLTNSAKFKWQQLAASNVVDVYHRGLGAVRQLAL